MFKNPLITTHFDILDSFFSDINDTNIDKTNDSYSIDIIAPGYKKDEFNIEADDGCLNINGETESDLININTSINKKYRLPNNVLIDKISAKYESGILNVKIPIDKGKSKKVVIK